MGRRKTTARRRMTAETERRIRGQEAQLSSDGDRGGRREGGSLKESDDTSKGWSGGSDTEGNRNKLTALPWGTQESGAGGLKGGARANGRYSGWR